jgi:hypothetical protein
MARVGPSKWSTVSNALSHEVKQREAFEKEGGVAEFPNDHFPADDNSPCLAAPRHRCFIIFVFGHFVECCFLPSRFLPAPMSTDSSEI